MSSSRIWIREYVRHLLAQPPVGMQSVSVHNGPYPGVRITGGAVPLELYAHDQYIRVGILSTDARLCESVRGVFGFEVIKAAKKWYTGYVRDERGIVAIDRLLGGGVDGKVVTRISQ